MASASSTLVTILLDRWPSCCWLIKVEKPQGDPAHIHPAFSTWNRGKQSVVIDLHTPEGQAQAQALIRSADVVIENFRPGVAERLGIGYETLATQHPRVI